MEVCQNCGERSVLIDQYNLALEDHCTNIEQIARTLRDRGWGRNESYSCAEYEAGRPPRLEDCPKECDCGY